MIDKQAATKSGYQVKESNHKADETKQQKIEQLKALMPSLVNSDGAVDVNAIKDFIESKNTTSNNKGYELTFAGKGLARALADIKTTKELKLEEKQSKNIDETENVIIRGDNLDVLKILNKNYSGKVKMIYIDPPYNTGSDNFLYKDNFTQNTEQLIEHLGLEEETMNYLNGMYGTKTHSGWLAFMYPRLKLARDLLTDDGVIFISIDDNEQANLKIMCDEIFGEDNFQYNLSVVNSLNGNDNSSGMMETQESCLMYVKNSYSFIIGVLGVEEEEAGGWQEDEIGFWKEGRSLKATGINAPRESRPNLFFPLYINENTLDFSLTKSKEYSFELLPLTDEKEMCWNWGKGKFLKDKDEIIVRKTKNGYSLYKKQRPALGDLPSKRGKTTFYKPDYSTSHGNAQMRRIFGDKIFDYPKSMKLIKDFIALGGNKDSIILDFFAGSGTTAQAVMNLNKEDGGKRKFILVQWDEEIDPKTSQPAYDFCKENNLEPVISSICIERVKLAGKEIKKNKSLLDKEVDIGYKVFSLTDRPTLETGKDGQLQLNINHATTKDTLYNMMAASGETLLSQPIEQIEEDRLYKVGDAYFVLSKCEEDLTQFSSNHIYIDGYADISLEAWLNMLGLDKDNVNILY